MTFYPTMILPEHNRAPHKHSQLMIFSEYLFQHVKTEHRICIQVINENIFQTFTADELYLYFCSTDKTVDWCPYQRTNQADATGDDASQAHFITFCYAWQRMSENETSDSCFGTGDPYLFLASLLCRVTYLEGPSHAITTKIFHPFNEY